MNKEDQILRIACLIDKHISQKMIVTLFKKCPQIAYDDKNTENYMHVDYKYQGGKKVFSRQLMQERLEKEQKLLEE